MIKVTKSSFNKEFGESSVTISTPLGPFSATCQCMLEDFPNISRFFGCSIAEMKATRKYAKAEQARYRERLRALESLQKDILGKGGAEPKNYEYHILKNHIKDTKRQLAWFKNLENVISEGIKTSAHNGIHKATRVSK